MFYLMLVFDRNKVDNDDDDDDVVMKREFHQVLHIYK